MKWISAKGFLLLIHHNHNHLMARQAMWKATLLKELLLLFSQQLQGNTTSRPLIRGRNFKNPPYRPLGRVPGGLRHKMNTVRPPPVTYTVPLEVAHNNSTTPQLQLQPSNETIQAASQGTRARFMQFIPTPRGPSIAGPRPRGPPPAGHSAIGRAPTGLPK
ncbi:talin-2 isoform X1 [Sesbania bispinosa]|nr:talin-2 isoform X1 [Sesbania bispinosa]